MARLPVLTWIGNAFAVLLGSRGDVTRQAQQAPYDQADKVRTPPVTT